ncbi:hypothetical protein BURPSS13_C0185 [Burkholderia pseudomallei S13]|nr:hypothetical protein BURPSS13_C0185 [Burkholderia pseudomallei S13]
MFRPSMMMLSWCSVLMDSPVLSARGSVGVRTRGVRSAPACQ